METRSISTLRLSDRLRSFRFAIEGFQSLWQTEWNIRIHFIATIAVITAGIYRHCNRMEWIALILAIALVWIAEAINTALEYLCDFSCGQQFHPKIKKVKDIAAAAVLLASLASACTGIIIFFF